MTQQLQRWFSGIFLLVLALSFFCFQPGLTKAYGWNWNINSFDSTITIQKDASFTVAEKLVIDYSREAHHGPSRLLPVVYRDKYGNRLSILVHVLSVTDAQGNPWPYEVSRAGDNLNIKIGDPDVLLDKVETFNITYQVQRALSFFDDHDELYWNVTGNGWDVPIGDASVKIAVPQGIADKDIRAVCYTGALGSTRSDCEASIDHGTVTVRLLTAPLVVQKTIKQRSYGLNANEGLTAVVGMPKGILMPPALQQKVLWFVMDNWGYFIPAAFFLILLYLWYSRGRDPRGTKTTIMPMYEAPDHLTPTEVGTIIDEKVDVRDISAAIIDLAVRGYLKIIEKKEKVLFFDSTDYEFKKLKDFENDGKLQEHEKKLLKAIFGGSDTCTLSSLKNKFYRDLPGIKNCIYAQLVTKGYFPRSPEKVRSFYNGLAIALIMVPLFTFGLVAEFLSISVPIGVIISGILCLIFGNFMPAKTAKGVDIRYQILGLEEYINTAEKDRLKFSEKENIFEKLLPFAMAFGIAEKWSRTFEGIYKDAPSWYQSSDPNFMNHFSSYYFYRSLDRAMGSMNTAFTSSPRSAAGGGSGFSGGFSGGGFGGGGGGSW